MAKMNELQKACNKLIKKYTKNDYWFLDNDNFLDVLSFEMNINRDMKQMLYFLDEEQLTMNNAYNNLTHAVLDIWKKYNGKKVESETADVEIETVDGLVPGQVILVKRI